MWKAHRLENQEKHLICSAEKSTRLRQGPEPPTGGAEGAPRPAPNILSSIRRKLRPRGAWDPANSSGGLKPSSGLFVLCSLPTLLPLVPKHPSADFILSDKGQGVTTASVTAVSEDCFCPVSFRYEKWEGRRSRHCVLCSCSSQ